jgi:hypothetical protein
MEQGGGEEDSRDRWMMMMIAIIKQCAVYWLCVIVLVIRLTSLSSGLELLIVSESGSLSGGLKELGKLFDAGLSFHFKK